MERERDGEREGMIRQEKEKGTESENEKRQREKYTRKKNKYFAIDRSLCRM
jgi:hypothetical protein